MDRYTKAVLTLIAFALWANLLVSFSPPGRGLIRDASAQGLPTRVVIVGVDMMNGAGSLPVTVPAASPVYLTPGPNPTNPMVLPVNLTQVGARWVQQGAAMPVDIEGIAGTAVKSSGGLPVALASSQPLAVTAKDPLPVLVTKMPPAPSQTSTATSSSGVSSSSTGPGGN
jgi:hypothetical protein